VHAAAFPAGEAWDAAIIAAQLGLPGVFGLVADAGGMILARCTADEAEILTLAVDPAARRRGVGRALVTAAAAAAAARGATRLLLEVSAGTAAARLDFGAGYQPRRSQIRVAPSASRVVARTVCPCCAADLGTFRSGSAPRRRTASTWPGCRLSNASRVRT
jgi:ribosomal-protein-alanine N-acetyltransferase